MALLTDQTLATGVTLNDLIHIVIPTDISQNPAGSSYKATVQQLFDSLSGNCISEFYVSNIHSCSPLNINPLDEGNVYFGSTSGVTVDLTNVRLGIGTFSPTKNLDVNGTTIHRDSVEMSPSKEIFWSDTSATWPTSINSRIRWQLNNDRAEIYSFQTITDDIDFVFKISDNAQDVRDNYVFWIDDFSGETFDRYPLEMNGPQFIVNPLRRYATIPANSGAGNTDFYILQSGATGLSQSVVFADVSEGQVGIGTTSPTSGITLDVNGGMRLRQTNGIVLLTGGETSISGTPSGDGIRFRYENNLFGSSLDGLVIEKTDFNQPTPDGGIMFTNVGSSGTVVPSVSIRGNGNVGIGTTSPLYKLHVDGDSLINNGLTADTLNISSTPTTDTNLPVEYLTRDSTTGEVKIVQIPGPTVYGLFAQTGNSVVVSATTVESSIINGGIGSLSVPANGFSIGDSFRADFGGLLSAKNNDTIRIRVKSGSVVLADSGAQTLQASTNDVWQFSVNFTVRQVGTAGVASIVTLGVFHTTKQSNGNQTGFAFNFINNTTFDTTTPNTLDVTAQFSSNSPLNSIYSDIFVLNKIF